MPTDPLNDARYPASSAVPNVNQDIQNAVLDLSDNTIPNHATTTERDNDWAAWVALGNSMRNGLKCIVNGVPYRRIGGNWRIDDSRTIRRTVVPTGGAASFGAGGSAETGITAGATGLASFTLYEAKTVLVTGQFRAGSATGVAACIVKINSAQVGHTAYSRTDGTVTVSASVALAAGTHTCALRVDGTVATVGWVDGYLTITECIAE